MSSTRWAKRRTEASRRATLRRGARCASALRRRASRMVFASKVGDATFVLPVSVLEHVSMTTTLRLLMALSLIARHASHRVSTDRAASWIGRATTSLATDSHLPPIRTAHSHRTRVSAMRDAVTRAGRRALSASSVRPGRTRSLRSGYDGRRPRECRHTPRARPLDRDRASRRSVGGTRAGGGGGRREGDLPRPTPLAARWRAVRRDDRTSTAHAKRDGRARHPRDA